MLGSRASFKLQGLAVDFDNRLWSKDARHRILTYPDLWLLVAGQALSSSSTSSLLSSRAPTSTAGQWLVVAVQAQQHFSRSAFPLLVAGARYALSLHRGDTSRANGRRQSASATLRWRSTQPVTRTAKLEQWIELWAPSVSVSALTACALPPPPRENFLKNVHIQRGRLGCRVASFSRWRLFLANP